MVVYSWNICLLLLFFHLFLLVQQQHSNNNNNNINDPFCHWQTKWNKIKQKKTAKQQIQQQQQQTNRDCLNRIIIAITNSRNRKYSRFRLFANYHHHYYHQNYDEKQKTEIETLEITTVFLFDAISNSNFSVSSRKCGSDNFFWRRQKNENWKFRKWMWQTTGLSFSYDPINISWQLVCVIFQLINRLSDLIHLSIYLITK